MARVDVKPELLRWALDRSGQTEDGARRRYPRAPQWLTGESAPTLRQLEDFSRWTRTPLGYLLLDKPPEDRLPIPDFRTVTREARRPSPDLLETIQQMQRRQEWMREFLLEEKRRELDFVGSWSTEDSVPAVVSSIRRSLRLPMDWAGTARTWSDALRELRYRIEAADIMVVINGVVGNNTHRPLDVNEFRGFALVDRVAPLVFVNGRDARCAQMFTLLHELAHIWVGEEGVSNLRQLQPSPSSVEQFCNEVAAEFLVPAQMLEERWLAVSEAPERFGLLARSFKVSAVVAARRALDLGHISRKEFFDFYDQQIEASVRRRRSSDGGDFWRTQNVRIGELFGSAVAQAVWAGRLLYKDAYELTGLRGKTFDNYVANLGL